MALLAPSILSCDFSRLKEQLLMAQEGGAEMIHIDVMDGHYVPNITFGTLIVEAVRKILPKAFLDVHLMIQNPQNCYLDFIQAGADNISFHLEVIPDFDFLINLIQKAGAKATLSICPGTPVAMLDQILPKLYMVLLMTVNPGFGGQKIIPGMDKKIINLRKKIKSRGLNTLIEIDGGIHDDNIEYLAACGASVIAAGSLVFSDENKITQKVREISAKIKKF